MQKRSPKGILNKKRPLNEGSKSGGPGSNRQPLAWKAKALPLSYRRSTPNYTKFESFSNGEASEKLKISIRFAKFSSQTSPLS